MAPTFRGHHISGPHPLFSDRSLCGALHVLSEAQRRCWWCSGASETLAFVSISLTPRIVNNVQMILSCPLGWRRPALVISRPPPLYTDVGVRQEGWGPGSAACFQRPGSLCGCPQGQPPLGPPPRTKQKQPRRASCRKCGAIRAAPLLSGAWESRQPRAGHCGPWSRQSPEGRGCPLTQKAALLGAGL